MLIVFSKCNVCSNSLCSSIRVDFVGFSFDRVAVDTHPHTVKQWNLAGVMVLVSVMLREDCCNGDIEVYPLWYTNCYRWSCICHIKWRSLVVQIKSNQLSKIFTNSFQLLLSPKLKYLSVLILNVIMNYFKFIGGRNMDSNNGSAPILAPSQNIAPNPHPLSIQIHRLFTGPFW